MTLTVGGYPGKMLMLSREDGVIFSECYGAMSTESGGPMGSLEKLLEDETFQRSVRELFGESGLQDALAAARTLLSR